VVVSPLLSVGELLTVLSGGSDNSLLSVVPPPLSIGAPLLPIRDGVVPLVVSGGAVSDDGDFLQLSALGC
jgi:hypothetical protein